MPPVTSKITLICHFPRDSFFYPQTEEFFSLYQNQEDISIDMLTMEGLPPPPNKELSPDDLKAMDDFLNQKYEEKIIEVSQRGDTSAVLLAQTSDPPIIEKYKHLPFPIVGMGFSSYWMAMMLTDKFSIFTPFKNFENIYKSQLSSYGYEKNCFSIECIEYDAYAPHEKLYRDFELIKACLAKIERLAEKGIQVIVMGCGSPQLSFNTIELNRISQKKMNVTVLSPIITGIEVCKALIYSRSSSLFQSK
jgi:Asp/Glu/hydantoin racemase